MVIDCFNGDADGILSLVILRHVKPINSSHQKLITGVKRDIQLCKKLLDENYQDAEINILDISFDKNFRELGQIIDKTKSVFYSDHHKAENLFSHNKLTAVIDERPDVCTAILIYRHLKAQEQVNWAITAAFGDNLHEVATALAEKEGLSEHEISQLKELGTLVNYNGYGANVDDLIYHPAELYSELVNYSQPFDILLDKKSPYYKLKEYYEKDMLECDRLEIEDIKGVCVVRLPNEAWARRVSGIVGNKLAYEYSNKPILVITELDMDNVLVSLRAPKNNPTGAGDICSKFETGGGRAAAAGINKLSKDFIDKLVIEIRENYYL